MAIALDFTGKVVVVVGGTSGINRGIAECFAIHGAKVAVASRKQQKVDETVGALEGLGAQAMGFAADVREPDALEAGMQSVHERFGDFDVVGSGAAGNFPALANDLSWNGFKTSWNALSSEPPQADQTVTSVDDAPPVVVFEPPRLQPASTSNPPRPNAIVRKLCLAKTTIY